MPQLEILFNYKIIPIKLHTIDLRSVNGYRNFNFDRLFKYISNDMELKIINVRRAMLLELIKYVNKFINKISIYMFETYAKSSTVQIYCENYDSCIKQLLEYFSGNSTMLSSFTRINFSDYTDVKIYDLNAVILVLECEYDDNDEPRDCDIENIIAILNCNKQIKYYYNNRYEKKINEKFNNLVKNLIEINDCLFLFNHAKEEERVDELYSIYKIDAQLHILNKSNGKINIIA